MKTHIVIWKWLLFLLLAASLMASVYFIGYYRIYDIEEDSTIHFFIKQKPVFKIAFENPITMPTESRRNMYGPENGVKAQTEYCRYRYGLSGKDNQIWDQCSQIEDLSAKPD